MNANGCLSHAMASVSKATEKTKLEYAESSKIKIKYNPRYLQIYQDVTYTLQIGGQTLRMKETEYVRSVEQPMTQKELINEALKHMNTYLLVPDMCQQNQPKYTIEFEVEDLSPPKDDTNHNSSSQAKSTTRSVSPVRTTKLDRFIGNWGYDDGLDLYIDSRLDNMGPW